MNGPSPNKRWLHAPSQEKWKLPSVCLLNYLKICKFNKAKQIQSETGYKGKQIRGSIILRNHRFCSVSDLERKHLKVAGNFAGAAFNLLFDVLIFCFHTSTNRDCCELYVLGLFQIGGIRTLRCWLLDWKGLDGKLFCCGVLNEVTINDIGWKVGDKGFEKLLKGNLARQTS